MTENTMRPVEYPTWPYKNDRTRLCNPYAPSPEGPRSRRGSPDIPVLDTLSLAIYITKADELHAQGEAHDAFDIDKTLLCRDNLDDPAYEVRAFARTIRFLMSRGEMDMATNFWDHLAHDNLVLDPPRHRTQAMKDEIVRVGKELKRRLEGIVQRIERDLGE